jgi:hypothetical protein
MVDTLNILFIYCLNKETHSLIESNLASGEQWLYRSLAINIVPDVYLDFVEIDLDIDPHVICLKFESFYIKEFCHKLTELYQVSISVSFFCKDLNFSGKYIIKGNMVSSINYSYWYGLYCLNPDKFWETIDSVFEYFNDFESLLNVLVIRNISQQDIQLIYQNYRNFQSMNYLNLAFQKL